MKVRIKALFAALLMVAGFAGLSAVVAQPAAAATINKSVNCYGYTYYGTVNYTRSGSNITINSYHLSGPNRLEWRARWFATAGNVIEDSGYQYDDVSPVNRYPGWSRYMGGANTVLLNVGKYNDGNPTCEMYFNIPAA